MSAEENANEVPATSLVIVAKNLKRMNGPASFLNRRGIPTVVAATLNEAIDKIAKKEVNMMLISIEYPHPKVEMIPMLFGQSFNIEVIIFAETDDRKVQQRLSTCKAKNILNGYASGPSMLLKVRQLEKQMRGETDEAEQSSSRTKLSRKPGEEENQDMVFSSRDGSAGKDAIVLKGRRQGGNTDESKQRKRRRKLAEGQAEGDDDADGVYEDDTDLDNLQGVDDPNAEAAAEDFDSTDFCSLGEDIIDDVESQEALEKLANADINDHQLTATERDQLLQRKRAAQRKLARQKASVAEQLRQQSEQDDADNEQLGETTSLDELEALASLDTDDPRLTPEQRRQLEKRKRAAQKRLQKLKNEARKKGEQAGDDNESLADKLDRARREQAAAEASAAAQDTPDDDDLDQFTSIDELEQLAALDTNDPKLTPEQKRQLERRKQAAKKRLARMQEQKQAQEQSELEAKAAQERKARGHSSREQGKNGAMVGPDDPNPEDDDLDEYESLEDLEQLAALDTNDPNLSPEQKRRLEKRKRAAKKRLERLKSEAEAKAQSEKQAKAAQERLAKKARGDREGPDGPSNPDADEQNSGGPVVHEMQTAEQKTPADITNFADFTDAINKTADLTNSAAALAKGEAIAGTMEVSPARSDSGFADLDQTELSRLPTLWRCMHLTMKDIVGSQTSTVQFQKLDQIQLVSVQQDGLRGSFLLAVRHNDSGSDIWAEIRPALIGHLKANNLVVPETSFRVLPLTTDDLKTLTNVLPGHCSFYVGPALQGGFCYLERDDFIPNVKEAFEHMWLVDLTNIQPNVRVTFNAFLYFPVNKKYVRYLKNGASLSPAQADNLRKNQVNKICVPQQDLLLYRQYFARTQLRLFLEALNQKRRAA